MERHPLGRLLDRLLGPVTGLGGRLLGRPTEDHLQRLTGRSRGGSDQDSGVALLERGRAAMSAGRVGEALALFSEAAEANPLDPWPWHGRGDALLDSGDSEGALSAYESALVREEDALPHLGRGNCLERLGRMDEAVAAFGRALELDSALEWAREGLARCGALNGAQEDSDV